MSKHTQEEWQLAGDNQDFIYALGPNGCNKFWAAVSSAGPDKISDAEKSANARLMIAAHDLLKLLVESQDSIGGDWRARRDAAIAKATGGA